MTRPFGDNDQLRLVVAWFSRQKASSIPESLKEPLRCYLARLPAAERKCVVPTKARKSSDDGQTSDDHTKGTLKSFELEALKYLKDKQIARRGTRMEDVRILNMVNALACTSQPQLSEKGFRALLNREPQSPAALLASGNGDSQTLVSTRAFENTESHLCRLFKLHQNVKSSADFHALALRILKVLIHHQFKLLKAIGIDGEAQEKEMLLRTGFTLEESQDLRARANGWLRFMSVFGVGALGIVQGQADDDFEKRASLPFLCDCRDFFIDKHPDMWQRMRNANKVVAGFFLQASTEYLRDKRVLLEGSEALSKCLRKAFEEPEDGTPLAGSERNTRTDSHTTSPLATLADVAVATAAAGGERGVFVPGSHHQSHDSQAWTLGVGRPASRLNTDALGLQNEGTFTCQVLGPASYEAGPILSTTYGQDVLPQWQMYAGQNPETIQGSPAESHASIAIADQVQANAAGSRANNTQQQLSGATSDMSGLNPEACGQSVQPQWLPRAQAHQNTVPNPAPAGSLVCFNEAEIVMANNSEAITAQMNDVWPAEWWDEFLDQGVGE